MSNNTIETIVERIIEALIEGDHITCHHDIERPTSDTPGYIISDYFIDAAGKAKVAAILAEATIPKQVLKDFADELGRDIR